MISRTKVGALDPLHSPAVSGRRPSLERLTDAELLDAVNHPRNSDPIRMDTRTGKVIDGNGRAYELKRRAADPASSITEDTEVSYEPYTPDRSMFWDV
jgi:hypothetical protein